MLAQRSTLKIGDRVQYTSDRNDLFGKFGIVVERSKLDTWKKYQTNETYVHVQFDGGRLFSAYRRNLIKVKTNPTWEV